MTSKIPYSFRLQLRRVLAPALLAGLAACTPSEPINLGFMGGLSGRVADLGIDGRNGALLAVEQRNQAGGIAGRHVVLQTEDDQQTPEIARQAVGKLIERKVAAIVGPMTSAMAVATVPLVNKAQIVMVSPTATTNDLTGLDDYFFRVLSSTRNYAVKSANHHYQVAGMRRMSAIYDLRNQAYTESWLQDYRAAFSAAGGSVIETISFSSGDQTHFAHLARKLLASKPDGVLLVANSVDAALLAQQLRRLNPLVAIVASEWSATERLIELGGRAVEGITIAQFLDRQSQQPAYVAFRKAYSERFGKEPGFAGLTAFDATNVVMDALASQNASQTLKEALLARKTFAGAQTQVVFDAYGDASRETFMTTIKDGMFVVLR